jgi:hypothetical protein
MKPKEIAKANAERLYFVEWNMKAALKGLNGAQLDERGQRGSDALFTASVAFPKDGSYSLYFDSIDGRTGEQMEDHEWFKIWMMLSKRLSESRTLETGKKEFAKITWDALRDIVLGGRGCTDPNCAVDHGTEKRKPHPES